jgi:hypothetical protein
MGAENVRGGHVNSETCRRGHPWTEETTYRFPNGSRTCRVCRDMRRTLKEKALAAAPPPVPGASRCSACDAIKPIAEFRLDRRRKSGVSPWCTPCWADKNRQRNHGIDNVTYDALLETQGGACAICLRPERVWNSLSVDHDHASGAIRGLLCHSCNVSLGHFGDSPDLLRRAAEYLELQFGLEAAI